MIKAKEGVLNDFISERPPCFVIYSRPLVALPSAASSITGGRE